MVFFRADGTRELTSEPKAFGLELQWPLATGLFATADLYIWGPNEHPIPVAFFVQAENLKTAGAWCD